MGRDMFGADFEAVRLKIEEYAKRHHHEYLTVEHLLLGLVDDEMVRLMLNEFEVNVGNLSDELKIYLSDYVPKTSNSQIKVKPTKSCERVLQRAIWHRQSAEVERPIDCMDILWPF